MSNFEKKTVNEWLKSINGRCDWCYKPEPSVRTKKSKKDSRDNFDKNRAEFLRELEEIMS